MKKLLKKQFTVAATALTVGSVVVSSIAPVVLAEAPKFEETSKSEGEAIQGGTIRIGTTGGAFSGVLNKMFYEKGPDGDVIDLFQPDLYSYDADFNITDDGFAKIEFDKDNKQVTIKIPEGHKWDDGEPITIDDVIFPYYVIGHKDYPGVRYGKNFQNVVGMEEYHEGKAETISGLERVDDYTLKVTYKTFSNSMLIAGGGVSQYIEPKHAFEGLEVKDMIDSDVVRKKPVGFGPFKVESITPGEAVTYVANEYYFKGKPKLDGAVLEVVNPSVAAEEMKAGKYDIITLSPDTYPTYKDATNFQILGRVQNALTYIGFKLGKLDTEKNEVVMDDTKVTSNVKLRQAMAYAVDNNAIGEKFYHGLRMGANTFVTPNFTNWYATPEEVPGYTFDQEKAKALLAEAGFKDADGDGFVEDLNGKPFTLKFASMEGSDVAEPLTQYYVESWKAVGINVELTDGRLLEFNAFYDRLEKDDPDIDVYQAAYGLGGDPEPSGIWSRTAGFNYARFASEENDKLMAAISSEEAFDLNYKREAFVKWQQYFSEQVPAFPTLYRYSLTGVNNRVRNYTIDPNSTLTWADVELTADAPVAE